VIGSKVDVVFIEIKRVLGFIKKAEAGVSASFVTAKKDH
jgi:hypothetical protein